MASLSRSRPLNKLTAIDSLTRKVASTAVGVVAFAGGYMFLFPTGCADVDGMPSWERCVTVMGNPAFSLTDWGLDNTLDILIPLAVAVIAGGVTWWLLGLRHIDRE
jgi:hypothetical protein